MRLRPLLAPLTPLYRLGLALRERRLASGKEPIRKLKFPVISIGNLAIGGAGKTPMAIALAKALTARDFHVDVLSRGYGRSSKAAARVRPEGTEDEFGDEPLLIASQAGVPVYVAAQRYDAGILAESNIAVGSRALHILDDGFQHRQLHRDIDILLLSGRDLEDHLLPAGNLREALHAADRAHVIAIRAVEPETESKIRARGWSGPIWRLHRQMDIPPADAPVLAFCGIARPEQFFDGLREAGMDVAATKTFRDHYSYTQEVLDWLADRAGRTGASALITTEKDVVRLRGLKPALPVLTAGLRTEIQDESAAIEWLLSHVKAAAES
ncbi:tetraacyldisaccharide 4'-kinase [Occallatibacter riparius]|uniref:Tetraacyldisaccharide 4'-kinase n=1 Tax=Occallatibacter riparius TaxID=1002689 RepID=A0A9J7BQM0_9BACT|nr:tetraacyldisaccharide 4'-kinase [Occallatibacter riparius]UWZ84984.1 tetraacyldisaccharide 4'-kinase [Occallatibacter riparius]